ncbi:MULTISPECIES: fluoride efflux transporter CrcB [Gracilibacillus]|uniref:Fluoride-specific ion channel FluC n=1 Tax=Gracilibacillus dipsosauri TaxID=178340 RepID=A0A317KVR5_9BACI|nr:fluoride efflux transporter CrcB [Gracilibacillus dipsosauri]PWU67587.1 fluoride efflux transporter CrcB [Gracilibacillus dipsosauri]
MKILLLTVGGSFGAGCRYWLGLRFATWWNNSTFPIAMLLVNILGSFGLGVFYYLSYQTVLPIGINDRLYIFLGVGFFGAFTTFSTFSVEAMQLWKQRNYSLCIVYVLLSIFGSILFFSVGFYIVRLFN